MADLNMVPVVGLSLGLPRKLDSDQVESARRLWQGGS